MFRSHPHPPLLVVVVIIIIMLLLLMLVLLFRCSLFRAIEALIVMNCFYMAMWATDFQLLAMKSIEKENFWVWEILM